MWRKIYRVLTDLGHVALGFITGVVGLGSASMMVLLFTGYMLYQFSEAVGDRDYVSLREDILEYMVGYVVFAIIYIFSWGVSCVE